MYVERLASQIKNDILSGLRGYHQNLSISIKQLEDEVVQTRLLVITSQIKNGQIPIHDLLVAINCIDVDCESLERCKCGSDGYETLTAHFEIPCLISEFGPAAIDYIGSVDRMQKFDIVRSLSEFQMKKYRKRGKNKPYVWIDYAPNENGMLDCFLFNCPFIKQVSVVGVFKDPRQIEKYECCSDDSESSYDLNLSFIDQTIKEQLVATKLQYYRQNAATPKSNNGQYSTGN